MSGRRRFGAIRRLPSGRFQARFPDPETGRLRPAPHTFMTKGAARRLRPRPSLPRPAQGQTV